MRLTNDNICHTNEGISSMPDKPLFTVIASVFNEQECLTAFYNEVTSAFAAIGNPFEIVFVNDGSTDGSLDILKKLVQADKQVRVIDFTRNFGHEAAMIAGIDHASGDCLICMDSDMQHPPKLIPEIKKRMDEGFEVVTMVRRKNKDANGFRKFRSRMFYRLLNRLTDVKLDENASDFFAVSKRVADVLRTSYRERTRFLRGLIQTVGFRKTSITYTAEGRFAGHSKYSFTKLLRLSLTAMSSFSKAPLKLGLVIGALFVLISFLILVYSIVMWFLKTPVSGYTTLIVFLCAFAGIQLFVIGLIGLYVGYIFDEVKNRPVYIVNEVLGEKLEPLSKKLPKDER